MRAPAPAAVDSVLLNIDVTGANLRTIIALCYRSIDLALWIVSLENDLGSCRYFPSAAHAFIRAMLRRRISPCSGSLPFWDFK